MSAVIDWRAGMARAFARGLSDGTLARMHSSRCPARFKRVESAEGFVVCYWDGFGRGAQECHCPSRISGKNLGPDASPNCGQRKAGA